MTIRFVLALGLLAFALLRGSALRAADPYVPLDIKPGTWEQTMTTQSSGAPPIPPDILSKMSPDQRAKMEAAMKGIVSQTPKTNTYKSCIKKEDIQNPLAFNKDQSACKATVLSSSRSKTEVQLDCPRGAMKMTGTVKVEALSSESVKISSQLSMANGANTMNTTMTGTSKWLGAACTEGK